MNETDERQGAVSSSILERIHLCPASFLRSRWMINTTSDDAERGTRIHDALETGDESGLSMDESETASRCEAIFDSILEEHGPKNEAALITREERLWAERNRLKFSGKRDVAAWYPDSKLLIIGDYKTGPRGATEASENLQLASLAVLAKEHQPEIERIIVAVIQPLKSPQKTLAEYDAEGLAWCEELIFDTINHALSPYADANPGLKQCLYCPARQQCPEAVGALADVTVPVVPSDVEELSRLIRVGELAEKITKQNKEQAKKLLMDGIDVPGFKLQETKGRSSIKADLVLGRLKDKGYSDHVLWSAVSLTKSKLESVVGTKTLKTGKALKAEIDDVLDGATVEGKPSTRMVHA